MPVRKSPSGRGNLRHFGELTGMDPKIYRRHAGLVRLTHWINAIALVLLLMSGLQIFNAHPSLYWGESSYTGAGPILHLPQGFPGWLTVPSHQWLAMGRHWHFFSRGCWSSTAPCTCRTRSPVVT